MASASPVRLTGADWLTAPALQSVFAALQAEGHVVRAVGGAVRDALMGRPVGEVDLAATAEPETVIRLAIGAGLKAVPTGIDHGTVTVVAEGRPFEVTTLRKDVETYGRRARVAYTTEWAEDARRRDFTVNALYADAEGRVHDPLGGYGDLEARRIRFIGKAAERIREDYLRILRFFRFNAEFGAAPIDAEGLKACVGERAGLARLSAERVQAELVRLLAAPGAAAALGVMFDHGLLVEVLGSVPHLARFRRLAAIEDRLGRAPDAVLRLAALALAVDEDAERLGERFRLSGRDRMRLENAALYRAAFAGLGNGPAAKAALYRAGTEAWRGRVLMAWAAAGAGADDAAWSKLLALPERWEVPAFPLKGADIVGLGVPKGPRVGEILRGVEDEWIAGGFRAGRKALLARAGALAKEKKKAKKKDGGKR